MYIIQEAELPSNFREGFPRAGILLKPFGGAEFYEGAGGCRVMGKNDISHTRNGPELPRKEASRVGTVAGRVRKVPNGGTCRAPSRHSQDACDLVISLTPIERRFRHPRVYGFVPRSHRARGNYLAVPSSHLTLSQLD